MKVLPRVLTVKPYQPGRPIDEVKRELGLKSVIKLASNESPYAPSPKVLAAISKEAGAINRYPDSGCYTLRRALSAELSCHENQLIFGNGSDEIIVAAIRAFVGEGDEVVVAHPSFLIYTIATQVVGGKVQAVPVKDFRYDLSGMAQAVSDRTKIVFLANPDNPAGTYISTGDLERFLSCLPSDIVVFLDEAYHEFVADRKDYPNSKELLKKYPQLIISRTFSKLYGLAGLRIGYGLARPEMIDILKRVCEPFNVNSLAQAAALACLKDKPYYRRIAREIEAQREFIFQCLESWGIGFVRTCTNFVLILVPGKGRDYCRGLLEKGIIVRDMSGWGLDHYIRVTIGTPKENKRFLSVFKTMIKR